MDRAEMLHIVAHNVKRYREKHNLSQEKFAEKAGISLSFCAAIETERKIPSTFTLRSMADNLGLTTDYFLYQDSVELEIKLVSALLASYDADYIAFIRRLIETCNDYYNRAVLNVQRRGSEPNGERGQRSPN